MKTKNFSDWLVVLFQDMLTVVAGIKLFNKKQQTPSYLAYNVDWFTNCTWLEQIQSFGQLSDWLDHDKGSYLNK